MAKKPTKAHAIVKASTSAVPEVYKVADTAIKPDQLFTHNGRKPKRPGPWSAEIDKLAWQDSETGLHCIILRLHDGALSGYVAVPPEHVLFGFNHDAIPSGIDIEAHGGLSYAEACSERGPECFRVCHSRSVIKATPAHAADQAWWFGFACNHDGDYVPKGEREHLRDEDARTYRDEAFVFRECTSLARQLVNIGKTDDDKPSAVEMKHIGNATPNEGDA